MIFDFHTHIFPEQVINSRDRFMDDPGFRMLYSSAGSVMTGESGLGEYIAQNALQGAAAMSFPWSVERYCALQNEYMASIAGSGGIYPFGIIPVTGTKSVRVYAGEIKNCGLSGIGEIAFYHGGMTGSAMRFLHQVLEAAEEFSLPVCIHLNEPVGHHYTGKYEPLLSEVYPVLKEHPGAEVILSHWGGGLIFYELMPEVREALKNVCYDTAATPFLYDSAIYSTGLMIAGADKIIFGSDYPLIGVGRYRDPIVKEVNSPDDVKKILSLNARRVLRI